MPSRALQRATARGLAAAGAAGLLFCGAARAWAVYYERREAARLLAARDGGSEVSARAAALERSKGGGAWGRLEIERIGLSALIAEGSDGATLAVALGHLDGSAFPGEPGTVALAGHRDTHLKQLEHVQRGDHVTIVTPEATFDYLVEATFIVPPERVDLIRPGKRARLALVTCYPFGYLGTAPLRMVVHARPAGSREGSG
jgi:sortase A